jgi:hypothetical protein
MEQIKINIEGEKAEKLKEEFFEWIDHAEPDEDLKQYIKLHGRDMDLKFHMHVGVDDIITINT